jgi:signal transduction histidine kinase
MNLTFKNRIALLYMSATAVVMAAVFAVIYLIVQSTVYRHLDSDLHYEVHKHLADVVFEGDSIRFNHKDEWAEREHNEVQVHPVFLQIMDANGKVMDKSPNLKDELLTYHPGKSDHDQFNTLMAGREIRQVQMPVEKDGKLHGHILAAMSVEDSNRLVINLRKVLLILFPLVLIGLFFITRWMAGRSIIPIRRVTETTDRITRNNLRERVDLPKNRDELHTLASSINELLDRMQDALEREKQFTSDASHELRTPLAVIKGTLEVLVRKPRTEAEYKEKIQYAVGEIDRMTQTVEQLLLLARLDNAPTELQRMQVTLAKTVEEILLRHAAQTAAKDLSVTVEDPTHATAFTDPYYLDLILDNVLSNAIKYSRDGGNILIRLAQTGKAATIEVHDDGIGIRQEDLAAIFQPFFRSEALNHKSIPGNGLGLSIVKRASAAIGAKVEVESESGKGTLVRVGV